MLARLACTNSLLLVYLYGLLQDFSSTLTEDCSYYYLLSPNILFLHILLFCTFYSIAHFTLYFSFFTYIYALVLCYFYIIFILLHCPLSGPDLIYISLLIIPCIIYYVTNKETLNLEEESIPETLRVVDILIRGTSAHAQALGQSMANMVQARRQVWLSQANLFDQDCMAVIAAPLVPGEVFGPPAEAALEQSRRTRELTRSVVRAPINLWATHISWEQQLGSGRIIKPGLRRSPPVCCPRGTRKTKPRSPAVLL